MLEYAPIIEALERGEKVTEAHPAVLQLEKDCLEKFNEDYVCVLGAENLRVAEVAGAESFEEEGCFEGWL
jgi:hypothetical protein